MLSEIRRVIIQRAGHKSNKGITAYDLEDLFLSYDVKSVYIVINNLFKTGTLTNKGSSDHTIIINNIGEDIEYDYNANIKYLLCY